MAKVRSWLDRHQKIRAIITWKYWRYIFVLLIVSIAVNSLLLFQGTWLYVWFKIPFISDSVFSRYLAMQKELGLFNEKLWTPTFATGVLAFGGMLIDDNEDGIPDQFQKGGEHNDPNEEERLR